MLFHGGSLKGFAKTQYFDQLEALAQLWIASVCTNQAELW